MKSTPKTPDDPIVAQVRQARAELFAEAGHDLRKLFANLKRRRKPATTKKSPPIRRSSKVRATH